MAVLGSTIVEKAWDGVSTKTCFSMPFVHTESMVHAARNAADLFFWFLRMGHDTLKRNL